MLQDEKDAFWYLPENLSASQKQSLEQFRSRLEYLGCLAPGQDDDVTLLRYLKARQWNIDNAAVMYSNMAKWRQDEQVDKLYETYQFQELDDLCKYYPHFYHKQDKFGRPVYIELLGKMDCNKMLEVTTQDRLLKYHIWTWERLQRLLMPACSTVEGKPIATCTVILDLSGVSMRHFGSTTRKLLHLISKIDQDYYPEHLGAMFIINTPLIFTAIWAVVSPLLEERTRKKIVVLGSNYADTLKQVIPEENLPTLFGGRSVPSKNLADSEGAWTCAEPCLSTAWYPSGPRKLAASLGSCPDFVADKVSTLSMHSSPSEGSFRVYTSHGSSSIGGKSSSDDLSSSC